MAGLTDTRQRLFNSLLVNKFNLNTEGVNLVNRILNRFFTRAFKEMFLTGLTSSKTQDFFIGVLNSFLDPALYNRDYLSGLTHHREVFLEKETSSTICTEVGKSILGLDKDEILAEYKAMCKAFFHCMDPARLTPPTQNYLHPDYSIVFQDNYNNIDTRIFNWFENVCICARGTKYLEMGLFVKMLHYSEY